MVKSVFVFGCWRTLCAANHELPGSSISFAQGREGVARDREEPSPPHPEECCIYSEQIYA